MMNQNDNTDRNCWVPRVCSYHFEKDDLELTPNGFRDLVANARPRLYLDGGGGSGDDDGGQVAEQEEVVSPPSVKNAKVRLDENVDYVKQKREENKKILAVAASRPLTIQAKFYPATFFNCQTQIENPNLPNIYSSNHRSYDDVTFSYLSFFILSFRKMNERVMQAFVKE